MLDPAWLCNNKEWLSVLLVILSGIGVLLGFVFFIFAAVFVLDKADDLNYIEKFNNKTKLIKDKFSNKKFLLLVIVSLLIVLCIWPPLLFLYLYMASIFIGTFFLIKGLNKITDKKTPKKTRIALSIFIGLFYLRMASLGIKALYGWWILHICGV